MLNIKNRHNCLDVHPVQGVHPRIQQIVFVSLSLYGNIFLIILVFSKKLCYYLQDLLPNMLCKKVPVMPTQVIN